MTSSTAAKSVRDRLIDAAEVCLRAKGIRATTVSEVAEAARCLAAGSTGISPTRRRCSVRRSCG